MRNESLSLLVTNLLASIIFVLGTLMGSVPSPAQQGQPVLQITSPAPNTIVNPGQTLSVTVTSPANAQLSQIAVVGETPIGSNSTASSVPTTFSLAVPNNISACRAYMLTAVGTTTSGQFVHSATILVDIERADMPTAINPQIPSLTFKALGEQFPLALLGTFPDGSVLDVTESSYVTYSSVNTSVATVDANGMVTGGSAGSTTITATYTLNGQRVQTVVPVTVPPPVMSVSPVSLSFGSQNVGTTSSAQALTITNTSHSPMRIVAMSAMGDFAETDNCMSSSPLAVSGSCTVNVTFTPVAVGSRQGSVNIANGTNSIPATVSLTGTAIGLPATTTVITSTANPSILGASVTLAVSVTPSSGSGTPTGTVTFSDGSTTLATVPLTNGQATFASSTLAVGSHSITVAYSGDSNFQASTGRLSQSVQYEPVGAACDGAAGHQILQPIDPGGTSVFKQGQTVPVKFRVCDANGVSIGSAGVVSSFLLTQTVSGTVTTNVEDIVDTNNPDTAFRWDSTDQQWIFNISTQNLAANSTYIYTITLNDGTTITFQFGLR